MAWNVVIAGGGFAGSTVRARARAAAADAVGAAVARQRRQLHALHAVPARGRGRHCWSRATSSRRCARSSNRTYLRLGAVDRPRPRRPDGRAAQPRGRDRAAPLRPARRSRSARSRGPCRSPASTEHAIGFKSLADAIWLRNHVVETLEKANATEDPARREQLLTYVFVGGGYAGLEALAELQDFAADAMDRYPRARLHGMRWILVEATDRVLPEIDQKLADYAVARAARPRHRGPARHHARGGRPPTARRSRPARRVPDPDRRLDRRASRRTRACANLSVPLDEQGPGRGRRPPRASRACEGVWALGDCAAVPDPARGLRAADGAARDPPGPASRRDNVAGALSGEPPERYTYSSQTAFVNLGRYKAVGRIGQLHVLGLPRLVDGPHLPPEPDPGPRSARSAR